MADGNVEIKVSQDLIKPIIESKIQAAMIDAMGGYPQIIEQIVTSFLSQRVDTDGKVSGYSSNKPRMEWLVNKTLTDACKNSIEHFMATKQDIVQAEFEKFFNSKKGQSELVKAMQEGLLKALQDRWSLSINFGMK